MKKMALQFFLAACLGSFSLPIWAAKLPLYAQPATLITDAEPNANKASRLKISVASQAAVFDTGVLVGSVVACSETACFRPEFAPTRVNLTDTRAGTSQMVVQFVIPRIKITSVHFEDLAGSKAVAGDISVTAPVAFDQEYFGEEILVVVKKSASGGSVRYVPVEAVAGFAHPSRQTVYYCPSTATVAKLGMGASLSIPAKATSGTQILSVAVNDVREDFPMIDIYPEISFNPAATVSAIRVRANSARLQAPNLSLDSHNLKEKKITKAGVITFDDFASLNKDGAEDQHTSGAPAISAHANETDACVGYLNGNASDITLGLASTGSVYINSCVHTSPNVHIAVSNVLDGRERGTLAYKFAPGGAYALLSLQTIPVLSLGTQIAINGFTWVGDSGYGPGSFGLANGAVEADGITLANNISGGGFRPDGSAPQDNLKLAILQPKGSYASWALGTTAPFFISNYSNYFITGSSTSILNNGSCTSESTNAHWSAIGSTPGGRLIFVSSTSQDSTTANQLCSVFSALGANYAIRLDGASAAGIAIDGVLLNPNTGAAQLVAGTARHIAYAITMGYTSANSATTPTITIPTRRTSPPPQCGVNRQYCAGLPINAPEQ